MYAFGYGLSYTSFAYKDLKVSGGETITATFTVTNTGDREGADVAQLYLIVAASDESMRLLGFERVELQPGESRQVTITTDSRLLARFDGGVGQWRITEGTYTVAVGKAADAMALTAEAQLAERLFGR